MARVFRVQYAPNQEMALTNMVYMNPSDTTSAYVSIGKFVYRCAPHADVRPGNISLNGYQRRSMMKMVNDDVTVSEFLVPMRDFEIGTLTLQADWLVKSTAPPPDLVELANRFRTEYDGHVISKDQLFVMYFEDNVYLKVKSDVRGLLTMKTNVGINWVV